MATHSPRRKKSKEPFVLIRVEQWIGRCAYDGTFEEVIKFIVSHTQMIDAPTDEFQASEGDLDRCGLTVLVIFSEDGRAIEIAGRFIQELKRRGIGSDPFVSADLDPVEELRKVIAKDLSDSAAMQSWATLSPVVLAKRDAESFDHVLARVKEVRDAIFERGLPAVVFTHEGIAPVMAFAELGSKLRQLPGDILAGDAVGFLNKHLTRIPARKEVE